jgi:hypothetical protein
MKTAAVDTNSSLSSSADNTNGFMPNAGMGKLPAAPRMQAFHMPNAPLPPLTPIPSLQVSPPAATPAKPTHMNQKVAEFFLNPPTPSVKIAQQGAPAAPAAPSGLGGLMGGLMKKFYPQQPGMPPQQPMPQMQPQGQMKPMAALPAQKPPVQAPAAPVGSSPKANQSVMGSNGMANKLRSLGF